MSEQANEGCVISIEEVEKALIDIENKYSPVKSSRHRDSFEETLAVLSKEFDSVGLPPLDITQSIIKIFKQVVNNSRSLVQIHRNTLSHLKDVNIDNLSQSSKSLELIKSVQDCKLQMEKYDNRQSSLQNKITILTEEQAAGKKKEAMLKNELERDKRYYMSKQNEHIHTIKKMDKENQRLKEMCGKDINIHASQDDIVVKMISKYKSNEEVYKKTIQKLQDNNQALLEELLTMREKEALQQ